MGHANLRRIELRAEFARLRERGFIGPFAPKPRRNDNRVYRIYKRGNPS
jgi:hypothetical protein